MPNKPALPFPSWWLALDVLAAALLAAGLLIRFAPGLADTQGLAPALAWPLIVVGALGLVACGAAIVRHLRTRQTPP